MKIMDGNNKETSEAAVIKTYFGMRPGDTLSQFMAEVKQLTPESKTELAIGSAKQLGYTVIA